MTTPAKRETPSGTARAFIDGIAKGGAKPLLWFSDLEDPTADRDDLATVELAVLATANDQCLGVVIKASDNGVHPVIGAPSFVVETKEGARALGFLFATPLGGEALERFAALIESKTGRKAKDQATPIPGVDGTKFVRGAGDAASGLTP